MFGLYGLITIECYWKLPHKIMHGNARVQFHSQGNLSADDNHVFPYISI